MSSPTTETAINETSQTSADKPNRPEVSIVIPAFNESAQICATVEVVGRHISSQARSAEIIVIDDGSSDDTYSQARAARTPALVEARVVRLARNFGKEAAILAGLTRASGDCCIVMDADLQHPPHVLKEMLVQWRSGAPVVNAVKRSRGKEPRPYRAFSRVFYTLLKGLSGYDLRRSSDFKLLDKHVVSEVVSAQDRDGLFRCLTEWFGYESASVEFDVPVRASGNSRWSIRSLFSMAIRAIVSFTSLPMHFITVAGCVVFLGSLVLAGHTLYVKLTGGAESGFSTVILLQLGIGSSIMIALGIMGEYIARIYDAIRARPIFVEVPPVLGHEPNEPRDESSMSRH